MSSLSCLSFLSVHIYQKVSNSCSLQFKTSITVCIFCRCIFVRLSVCCLSFCLCNQFIWMFLWLCNQFICLSVCPSVYFVFCLVLLISYFVHLSIYYVCLFLSYPPGVLGTLLLAIMGVWLLLSSGEELLANWKTISIFKFNLYFAILFFWLIFLRDF